MAWNTTYFSFLTPTVLSPGTVLTFDLIINENTPGILFEGTEANAVFAVLREIAGDFWLVQNADWNGVNWIPKNLSAPVTFTVFRSPTSVSFPGYQQKYQIAAGINPAVPGPSNLIMQLTNLGQLTTLGQQKGTAVSQAADGSTNTITFPTAFATATDQIFLSITDAAGATGYYAPVVLTKTASAVTYMIAGGQSGATVSVDWIAFGH